MKVHTDIERLPRFRNAVITIGTFDGVHTGHKQVIAQLKEEAERIHGESVIITFHPHPRRIVGSGQSKDIKLINSQNEKAELLSDAGVDHLVVVPFTHTFAALSAKEYVKDFLVEKFHPHTIIIGYDHRFGQGRTGDYHLMETYGQEFGFIVREIPVHVLDAISVSSTRIRHAIESGEIETANHLLGYTFFFDAKVVEGNKLGRTIGYPTANLEAEETEKIIPSNGVYAVDVDLMNEEIHGKRLKGMMNIGVRPTVGGTRRVIEVNIFEFDGDLYGKTIRVYVKKRLRDEKKFDGLESLKKQLADDRLQALNL